MCPIRFLGGRQEKIMQAAMGSSGLTPPSIVVSLRARQPIELSRTGRCSALVLDLVNVWRSVQPGCRLRTEYRSVIRESLYSFAAMGHEADIRLQFAVFSVAATDKASWSLRPNSVLAAQA